MIAHRDEIFSRPKRTWFVTEHEKNVVAKAAKVIFLFMSRSILDSFEGPSMVSRPLLICLI